MTWFDGMHVRIVPHAFWPRGADGTVRPFPDTAAALAGGARGCTRVIRAANGPIDVVWVVFDQPAADGDGDGPYHEGEVMAEHLTLINSVGAELNCGEIDRLG